MRLDEFAKINIHLCLQIQHAGLINRTESDIMFIFYVGMLFGLCIMFPQLIVPAVMLTGIYLLTSEQKEDEDK